MSASADHSKARGISYRPEIDGLRAIAVVAVILFHAAIPGFAGGYIGVDIFFVISGYLICSIITRQQGEGQFGFIDFYERRIRRILPALFFYAMLAAVLAVWFYPPLDLRHFGQSLVAVSFFASNILFYLKTSYFNDFAETAPLLHSWSLAVEEQFYLVVPLLLAVTLRRSSGFALAVMALLLLASLVHSQAMLESDPPFAFYMVTSRFWELAVGGCIALIGQHWRMPRANDWLALVGLVLIGWPILTYDGLTPFPGIAALVPVAGTALLILFASGSSRAARILGHRWLVAIGLISYSWYLSHFVLFAVARTMGVDLGLSFATILLVAISLILATATYLMIERPARRVALARGWVIGAAVAGSLAVAAIGFGIHLSEGLRETKLGRLSPELRSQIVDFKAEQAARDRLRAQYRSQGWETFDDDGRRKTLIIGDSKAVDFYVATRTTAYSDVQFRHSRLDDECMAGRDRDAVSSACRRELQRLEQSGSLDVADEVVLTANWQMASNARALAFVEELRRRKIAVSVVSSSEFTYVPSLSYTIARRQLSGSEAERFIFDNIRGDRRRAYLALKALISEKGLKVRFLEKLDLFCDRAAQRCSLRDGDQWLIIDSGHLSVKGSYFFGERIKALGWYK